jgi:hypothetical protein
LDTMDDMEDTEEDDDDTEEEIEVNTFPKKRR